MSYPANGEAPVTGAVFVETLGNLAKSAPLDDTSTYASSANKPFGLPNSKPFSNTAKSGPDPLRMPCGNVTVKNPGESPAAIWAASRSPRLLNPVLEIVVLPTGAK